MKLPSGILIRATLGWATAGLLGTSAILLARIPGFPFLVAAQMTAGIIGLGGGLSYAAAIRAAGGDVDGKNGILLALLWSLCCILGVTPLFFTLGTALKMTVSAFYSFAFCGALGGIVTLRRMRSLFPDAAARDVVPSVVVWSLGFGLAVTASNGIGEGLQRFLPEWAAWLAAYEVMAVIAGGAGYFAIARFLEARDGLPDVPDEARRDASPGWEPRHPVAAAILLCLPFYLNDLSDIYINDWRWWLSIDTVAGKLFPLLVLAWLVRGGKPGLAALGVRAGSGRSFFSALAVGTAAALFIDQNAYLLTDWFRSAPWGRMPEIASPLWRWVDLTAGLAAVSIVEETIFRGYLRIFLFRYTRRSWMVIAVSALAFGLIHWSGGVHKILTTAAIGAVFMALYLRTQSLPAIMASHYLVNVIAFSSAAPQSLFRFF